MENNTVEIITVDEASKANGYGFFCYKSKPKAEGYRCKLAWLEERFEEGLQIKIIQEDGRSLGFIEYTPGEFAWRPIAAEGYMVIHCLWVVGRAKEKGYGSRLIELCIQEAKARGMHGVAALTKKGGYLVGKKIFLQHGFEVVDQASPTFKLVAKTFDVAPLPSIPQNWKERQAHYGEGLTVIYAHQCPYYHDAVKGALEVAADVGIQTRQAIELKSAQEAQNLAPCPYGTFGIVYEGTLVTCTPLSAKKLKQRLQEILDENDG